MFIFLFIICFLFSGIVTSRILPLFCTTINTLPLMLKLKLLRYSSMPDLLVGAPFFFSKDAGGAVYLYLNKEQTLQKTHDLKLVGKQESQFGISIANAGDLNKDGCQDVAIGSPYEGNGVVYIFMGDKKIGLNSKPNQVITAENLPVVLKTFGYSLSGGVDLDANGYPDLLVGAYENVSINNYKIKVIIIINYLL